jgi:AcrR family transcriptional regulator
MRSPDPTKAPRILEAASQLFSEKPYHEVRMDDIASRAGVAKGTLYLHFRDKEALYLALIEQGMTEQLFNVFEQVVETATPLEKLRSIVSASVGFFDQFPYFLELLPSLEAKGPSPATSSLINRRDQFLTIIQDVLRELSLTSTYEVLDPEFSALCLVGLIHEVLRSHERPWPTTLVDRIERQFLHGVRGVPVHAA